MAGCHPILMSPCATIIQKEGRNRQIHTFGRLHCQTRQTLATFYERLQRHARTRRLLQMNGRGSKPAESFQLRIPFRVSCQVLSYSIGGIRGMVGNTGVEDGAPGSIWLTQPESQTLNTVQDCVRRTVQKSTRLNQNSAQAQFLCHSALAAFPHALNAKRRNTVFDHDA